MWDKSHGLIGQKQQNTFPLTHMENFIVDMIWADKQACKQAHSSFPLPDRYFSAFWVVISAKHVYFSLWANAF